LEGKRKKFYNKKNKKGHKNVGKIRLGNGHGFRYPDIYGGYRRISAGIFNLSVSVSIRKFEKKY